MTSKKQKEKNERDFLSDVQALREEREITNRDKYVYKEGELNVEKPKK